MIPKIIHYCWFGNGEKNKKIQKCIASWKKYCPDYQMIEWNETNFDINRNGYTRYCYDNQKWAFLSDYARLVIVAEYGGIYLDTDVEMVKPFDDLLSYGAFYSFEDDNHVNTGQGFGAEAHHPTILAMQSVYDDLSPDGAGVYPIVRCPQMNTEALIPFGLNLNGEKQCLDDAVVLPVEYMNPYNDLTGRMNLTENTYSIHWYSKTWLDKRSIIRSKLTKPIHRILGVDFFNKKRREV